MMSIEQAVEAEIERREAVMIDPHGVNMIIDPGSAKPRPCKVSEIAPDYAGIRAAAKEEFTVTPEDVRMSCVGTAAGFAGKSAKDIIREADLLADFILNGKAKPEEKSNG
jgi:hypothetical protein